MNNQATNRIERPRIAELLRSSPSETPREVPGWIRTKRDSKNVCFLEINDGSSLQGLQAIIDKSATDLQSTLDRLQTGASVLARGILVASPGTGQSVELACTGLDLLGEAPAETYPLQKKRHSFEFLREIAHLRGRTNTFGAVMRVRNRLSIAVHQFFQEREFLYLNTPIITASDAEGAGALFQVTTLDMENPPRREDGSLDYSQDFFGKPAYLTVSGQLNAEAYATALDRVYTFGPTFRAENSNTTRHLAEFWMIEPEMAFCDLEGNMGLAEDFVRFLLRDILERCPEDMEFFDKRIEPGIAESLRKVAESDFRRMTYTEAIDVLEKSGRSFAYSPHWGIDLQTEHEKFLTEDYAQGPVIVTDYPREIKAFYMKQNPDGRTVRAMDVLVPRLGEIIGGSQREEELTPLEEAIRRCGLETGAYQWYLDLRRFGTVPHAGFGLGFERLVRYVTGMQNIRDVIPFPRAVGSADF
ncbi:asparagine--tRNA ligase [Alkalispirochaeta sphaeroplastigenens]|uniref:asparagine--tRNA ligase n=1 Tax=Alkalispirochaeta sphaeroplastigenens TaxID=1187066 RepID=UPI001FE2EC72|nr:asparagine--tRNA ligase [Alkalispirochaeta sphaeroplastigenens]